MLKCNEISPTLTSLGADHLHLCYCTLLFAVFRYTDRTFFSSAPTLSDEDVRFLPSIRSYCLGRRGARQFYYYYYFCLPPAMGHILGAIAVEKHARCNHRLQISTSARHGRRMGDFETGVRLTSRVIRRFLSRLWISVKNVCFVSFLSMIVSFAIVEVIRLLERWKLAISHARHIQRQSIVSYQTLLTFSSSS